MESASDLQKRQEVVTSKENNTNTTEKEEQQADSAKENLNKAVRELIDMKALLSKNQNKNFPNFSLSTHKIAIAPMIDVSTIHFRFFIRLLTRYSTLYTEMIHANAIVLNPRGHEEILRLNQIENPIVCQLGGNDPKQLAAAARLVQ